MTSEALLQRVRQSYGLSVIAAELLRPLGDQVYRLTDEQGQRYVLKQSVRPARERLPELQAIDRLTVALRQTTDLAVPILIPDSQGNLAVIGTDDLLVLYRWVDGEISSQLPVDGVLTYRMGIAAGEMHRCAQTIDERFAIRTYDQAYVQRLGHELLTHWPPDFDSAYRPGLATAIAALDAHVVAVGYDTADFGLIHADFHFGNMTVAPDGRLGVIDFDEIAYGHFWFDLTNMINEFADYPEQGEMLQAQFLQGYFSVRPLLQDTLDQLPVFIGLSGLVFAHWVFTAPNESVRRTKMQYVPDALAQIMRNL